jgi:polyisoprenoid-binding protein YceI
MASEQAPNRGGHHWWRWLLGGIAGLAILIFGGAFVYIHFIEGPAPAPLTLSSPSPATGASTAPSGADLSASQVDGTWTVTKGSLAGYRVQEVLAGQNNTAVGRGSGVSGSWTIAGTDITKGSFVVNLTTVTSDSSQRDQQFNGRIMNTAQFPNATFTLTSPISLGSIPKVNQIVKVTANGTLTMHGVTKPVVAALQATDTGSAVDIAGTIPVLFSNWDIANPSFGSFVKTENHGIVEFSLKTAR